MTTLPEFLLARIAEDEADIEGDWAGGDGGLHIISAPMHDRLIRDCEAKRRIVEDATNMHTSCVELDGVVALLATVYANHPDYREEWST